MYAAATPKTTTATVGARKRFKVAFFTEEHRTERT